MLQYDSKSLCFNSHPRKQAPLLSQERASRDEPEPQMLASSKKLCIYRHGVYMYEILCIILAPFIQDTAPHDIPEIFRLVYVAWYETPAS